MLRYFDWCILCMIHNIGPINVCIYIYQVLKVDMPRTPTQTNKLTHTHTHTPKGKINSLANPFGARLTIRQIMAFVHVQVSDNDYVCLLLRACD